MCGSVKGWWHKTLRKQMIAMKNFDVENLKLSKCSINGYNIGSLIFSSFSENDIVTTPSRGSAGVLTMTSVER